MVDTILDYWPAAMAAVICLLAITFYWEERQRRTQLEKKFRVVVDADKEARRILHAAKGRAQKLLVEAGAARETAVNEAARTKVEAEATATRVVQAAEQARDATLEEAVTARREIEILRKMYSEKREVFDRLTKEVAVFDERLAFAEMGLYEPHFEFSDSEEFKAEIERVRVFQKRLVENGDAVVCRAEWSVDGSRTKGKTMTKKNIKLTLRAFNGECDAAISNIRWNNAVAMQNRITKVREQLDKLNESNTILITDEYLKAKLRELRLTHEHREKLKQEKEERAEAARVAREEQKLLRDLENAQAEEERYEGLLAKAKTEAARIQGLRLEAFNEQVRMLERNLAEAQAKALRAKAMAEKTSSGFVYIISNVGSFGEDVVKIGLTRRLDPLDRVRELGDASVPFVFDTHAIIYSDNAPVLERALHMEFEAVRINTQNSRKEFFRVSLHEVETAVKKLAPEASFIRDIEAQEYRETLARRLAQLQTTGALDSEPLPIAV